MFDVQVMPAQATIGVRVHALRFTEPFYENGLNANHCCNHSSD
jgi:hypothetical protein